MEDYFLFLWLRIHQYFSAIFCYNIKEFQSILNVLTCKNSFRLEVFQKLPDATKFTRADGIDGLIFSG